MNSPNLSTEKELLMKLKYGCPIAFERLYNNYKYRLAINILKLVKDEELTQDILQELFIKIWNNRSTIDADQSFQAYLYKIAKNLVVDKFRKSTRDRELEAKMLNTQASLYTHIEEYIEEKENTVLLEKILSKLPPQRRVVFTLCRIEGKSYKEVSEALGISIHTVNDHMKKANASIKKHLSRSDILLAGMLCNTILMNL